MGKESSSSTRKKKKQKPGNEAIISHTGLISLLSNHAGLTGVSIDGIRFPRIIVPFLSIAVILQVD